MAKRSKVSNSNSKAIFRATAVKTKKQNVSGKMLPRGGYRL